MTSYRFYCLDGEGHISLAEWLDASSDEEALAEARRIRPNAYKCEVWQEDRLLAQLTNEGTWNRQLNPAA